LQSEPERIVILGAAGRDFHNFNVLYRNRPEFKVVAFTATQIPNIDDRTYPAALAGTELYPNGILIHPEEDIEKIIRDERINTCVFSYSDVSYVRLMQLSARVLAAGSAFELVPPERSQIKANVPVVAVVAVRTGSGKSQTTRRIVTWVKEFGKRAAVIRHPMPYGDLVKQKCQRFASLQDLADKQCTIEEMEEYEPHIVAGNAVYAGVDYEEITRRAEAEADIIVWDGGNNDASFLKPDLTFTVADPFRVGHELTYYPGEINLITADIVVINKVDTANPADVRQLRENIKSRNPKAKIVEAESLITVEKPELLKGAKALLVEDGPTLTHGEMDVGAAYFAAKRHDVGVIVDPRPYAVNSIKAAYEKYPQMKEVLPALGYGEAQLRELEETINRVPCDVVVVGTPIDLSRIIKVNKPTVRVKYELKERDVATPRLAVARLLGHKW
jgi:predicted GTPase